MDANDRFIDLYERCPLLEDSEFTDRFPGIQDVVSFMDGASRSSYRMSGMYGAYDNLGISTTSEFVALMQADNAAAVMIYERVRDIAGFA